VLASVDLYWLPLGAGGHSVRFNGKVFEALAARVEKRTAKDLYHSALEVTLGGERFVLEQAPAERRELSVGLSRRPIGARWARRLRIFRYEVRCWREGAIPDVAEAVDSPHRLTDDPIAVRRLLDILPQVPTPVWGRDELQTGEMWNSNSVIPWVLSRAGIDIGAVYPPESGRAPGWDAGVRIVRRQSTPR
jgi:hypothetical protein